MNRITMIVFIIIQFFAASVFAETIKVSVEPFPPLINEDKTGASITLLKEIEKVTDLKFEIIIAPYNRAKLDLKSGKTDLIGHTPHGKETQDFYAYAQDLAWSIPAVTDIYAMKKETIEPSSFAAIKVIGVPRGNKEFFSELYKIPLTKLYEGELDNLLKMLKIGRINAFIFERASSMETLKKLKIEGVSYKALEVIGASFGTRKDAQGSALKEKLDKAIKTIDVKKIYKGYETYTNMPSKGVVRLK